ncbi:MAG: MBL fold metallo-hydrolase [Flammeovirgaceae bacterium]
MKVTFLGTGTSQGVPVIACKCEVCQSVDFRDKRTRTSIYIEIDGLHLVIDTGTDFRTQMLREGITQLDAVIFTHQHKDHTAGLDDIRPFYFQNRADMPIYATKPVIDQLQQEFAYIFAEHKYPGVPGVIINYIERDSPFKIKDTTIIPIEVMHYKLPVLGFRFNDFSYITDANHIEEQELEKLAGSEVLVLNALHHDEHISHFNLKQAIEVAKRVNAKQTYFTHMSHRMGLHQEVSKTLPKNMAFAYDGLKLEL